MYSVPSTRTRARGRAVDVGDVEERDLGPRRRVLRRRGGGRSSGCVPLVSGTVVGVVSTVVPPSEPPVATWPIGSNGSRRRQLVEAAVRAARARAARSWWSWLRRRRGRRGRRRARARGRLGCRRPSGTPGRRAATAISAPGDAEQDAAARALALAAAAPVDGGCPPSQVPPVVDPVAGTVVVVVAAGHGRRRGRRPASGGAGGRRPVGAARVNIRAMSVTPSVVPPSLDDDVDVSVLVPVDARAARAAGRRDRHAVDDHQALELLEQPQVVLQLEEAALDRDRER